MKKKNSTRDNVNLFFSAFLVIAYIVCAYFFVSFAQLQNNAVLRGCIIAAVLVLFGLLVFYATRVGEGKTVFRFSLITLIVLDIPALYIIIASVFTSLPFSAEISEVPAMVYMAAIAFGYAVPYTFISGFETVGSDDPEDENEAENNVDEEENSAVLEGGVEADIIDAAVTQQSYEPETDEIILDNLTEESGDKDEEGE